jgi:hypothetical protein
MHGLLLDFLATKWGRRIGVFLYGLFIAFDWEVREAKR